MELTIEQLKEMKPGIFATGTGTYPELNDKEIRWVAVRGGMHDWTIYFHLADKPKEYVADYGDKCYDKKLIRRLVPCTEEAYGMYRF